jgi:hypothetical protein
MELVALEEWDAFGWLVVEGSLMAKKNIEDNISKGYCVIWTPKKMKTRVMSFLLMTFSLMTT